MTPGAHLLSSWILADTFLPDRRERRLVALMGVLPDLDGLGVVADLATRGRTEYFPTYHHLLGHNLFFGLLGALLAAALAGSHRLKVLVLAFGAFHLHLLCDLVGSKGPDGYLWPLHYLYPLVPGLETSWHGQWLLNGWQNLTILLALFAWSIHRAVLERRSFAEVISARLDSEIFRAIERRWPA